MDNARIFAPLLALLAFVGALIFDGAGRTTCLVVGVIAAAVTLVLELRRARART